MPDLLHVQHDLHIVQLGQLHFGHDLRHHVPRRPVWQLGCLTPCLQCLQRRLLCLHRLDIHPVLCLHLGQLPLRHDLRHDVPCWYLCHWICLCQLQHTLLGVQWQCIRVHSLFYRLPLWIVLRRLLSNWNLPQWQHVFGL